MSRKDIYKLDMHEVTMTTETDLKDWLFTTVMRVPGGWIYRSFDKGNNIMAAVFVPFDNEFQEKL